MIIVQVVEVYIHFQYLVHGGAGFHKLFLNFIENVIGVRGNVPLKVGPFACNEDQISKDRVS